MSLVEVGIGLLVCLGMVVVMLVDAFGRFAGSNHRSHFHQMLNVLHVERNLLQVGGMAIRDQSIVTQAI